MNTAMLLFVACLLIGQFDMPASWYFIAVVVALVDFILSMAVGSAVSQKAYEHILNKRPGIRGTIDGGKDG